MSAKKRKTKRQPSGPPPASSQPPSEVSFARIGKPEIDRILREQTGMSLPLVLERASVLTVQEFVDQLEREDDAVNAVRAVEQELEIDPLAPELPELPTEEELRLTIADREQERLIAEVDKRLLAICRECIVELERRAVRAEKDLEHALHKTAQAEEQAGRHERRAEERVAEAQTLRGSVEKLEDEVGELREQLERERAARGALAQRLDAAATAAEQAPRSAGDQDAEISTLRSQLDQREALLLDAHAEREQLEIALESARREVARLQHIDDGHLDEDEAGNEPLPKVESVLEAVKVAQERCEHLVFTDRAFETAAESPFWRPDMILSDLMTLDQVAEAYMRPEGIGMPVGQLAQDLGLDWRSGVGEVWYGIHPNDYHFNHEGKTLRVGEHIRVANGSGAQRMARIYAHFHSGSHAEDDLPRGVYVGPVGRKLPDSTTG